jgi:hypothetical protein
MRRPRLDIKSVAPLDMGKTAPHKSGLAIFSLVLALLLVLPLPVYAFQCPLTARPVVSLEARQDPVSYDYSQNLNQLQQKHITNSVHSHGTGVTMGAAASQMAYGYKLKYQMAGIEGQSPVCAALIRVDVEIKFTNNIIYLASELPPGSCIRREVLLHEEKHMREDLYLIQEKRYVIQQVIERAIRDIGTVNANSPEEAQQELQRRIAPIIDRETQNLMQERTRRQALVDTPQEYERVSKSCNGEAQPILRRFLGRS